MGLLGIHPNENIVVSLTPAPVCKDRMKPDAAAKIEHWMEDQQRQSSGLGQLAEVRFVLCLLVLRNPTRALLAPLRGVGDWELVCSAVVRGMLCPTPPVGDLLYGVCVRWPAERGEWVAQEIWAVNHQCQAALGGPGWHFPCVLRRPGGA